MKKAIVTGANGFVGRYLVRELTNSGYRVWAVVRDETADISCLKDFAPSIVYCDLACIETLPEKLTEDVSGSCFYHLAWAGSSGAARTDYKLQLENAAACANAAKAAKELNCRRFVGAGSVTELVYRNYLQQDGTNAEMIACYAIGKIAAEYLTRCVCSDVGIEYNWTHISNFYGVGDTTDNFINFLLKHYLSGKTPELTAGTQYTDFTYVSDVAAALFVVGEYGIAGSTYYVGYGKPRPLREFVLTVRNIVDPKLNAGLGQKEFLALPIDYEKVDVGKLYRETGFMPKVSFEEGIHKTINWMQRNGVI